MLTYSPLSDTLILTVCLSRLIYLERAGRSVANKPKKSSKPSAADTDDGSVVRIKAGTASTTKKASKTKNDTRTVAETPVVKAPRVKRQSRLRGLGIFAAIGGYFKGAWTELRQVRWPNRRATWSLTGAVLAYTAFFVIIVLLLDAAFKYLFEIILGN
jgi:preprotein translocase SecE subunit